MKKSLLIASDHAGFDLKKGLIELIDADWHDLGVASSQKKADYPLLAKQLCLEIKKGAFDQGILICGTGIGMSIAANRYRHIRAAAVQSAFCAALAKEHNHLNVLCLGSRVLALDYAVHIVQSWLGASESKASRHVKRLKMLS
jgi:ribose 5-phosphate isomerase B